MKRLTTLIGAMVALLAFAATSAAAAPTVTLNTKLDPMGRSYKDAYSPTVLDVSGTVVPAATDTMIQPLANVTINFPKDLKFDVGGTPVCKKDIGQIDPANANVPPAIVRGKCPKSIIGGGTAIINPFGQAHSHITDPVLTEFNGGRDKNGNPRIYITGYSQQAQNGVIMIGILKGHTLSTDIPDLAFHSATTQLHLTIPGDIGLDRGFVKTKCSTGTWESSSVFTLGTFSQSTGGYTNEHSYNAPPSIQQCHGVKGKPKFGRVRVKGPKKARRGKKTAYKVTIRNNGTATARKLKVKVSGKGAKGRKGAGSLAPGAKKTVKVKVKFTKKGKVKARFKVTAKGAKTRRVKKTVRVR